MDSRYSFPKFNIQVWRDPDGAWHYDGPAGTGPRNVRTSGRGPYWRGPVTRQFVVSLIRAVKRAEEN